MADLNTPLMQHVFHIPKRKWKSDIHHYRKANDLRRCFEIAKGTAFCHPQRLGARPARFNPFLLRQCPANRFALWWARVGQLWMPIAALRCGRTARFLYCR
jgi:hypothetical protein